MKRDSLNMFKKIFLAFKSVRTIRLQKLLSQIGKSRLALGGLMAVLLVIGGYSIFSHYYFAKAADPIYCTPTISSSYYGTTNVALGAINNSTGIGGGYSDYTNLFSTDLKPGLTYTISATAYVANVKFWIDFNQDGVFSGAEFIGTVASLSEAHSFNFTVPGDAVFGVTRFRVGSDYLYSFYPANLTPCHSDSGEFEDYSVNILLPDIIKNVDISAVVDPIISFSLLSNLCDLGTLVSATVKTCPINLSVSTNATSGYAAYIKDLNNGALISGSDSIVQATGSLTAGTPGFGVGTDNVTSQVPNNSDCSDGSPVIAGGLLTTNQSIASSSAPVQEDLTTVCVATSISALTPAGSYYDTVYITVVGNF